MSQRSVPVLRHPTLGIPMPWIDTRIVPASTLCEYLGCDYTRLQSLSASGAFAAAGCVHEVGESRPVASYCPARIWSSNGWLPDAGVLQLLTLRPHNSALRAMADQLGALQNALAAVTGDATPALQEAHR